MGLTTSLYTGLTGLAANSQTIDVTGNNIANVNTNAFKSSRVNFETAIAQTPRSGSAPSGQIGGTNPAQVGLGTRLGSITADFSNGALSSTGVSTDLAIEGDGFFVVDDNGSQRFTRNGNFSLDRDFNLTTAAGGLVQGYGVDEDFNVVEGVLTDITIPIGVTTIASPTTEVKFAGNLNAGGDIATQGSITDFEQLFSDAGATVPATGATALTALTKADLTNPFALGDVITISGATRGGSAIPDRTFEINAAPTLGVNADANGTTLQDFADFLDNIFGIDQTAVPAGVSIAGGVLSVTGNVGSANGISFDDTNLIVNQGTAPSTPLQLNTSQQADGESTLTTFAAFDSLGNPLTVNLVTTLVTKDANGTQWSFSATAEDDTDIDTFLGTGTANFDTEGQFIGLNNAGLTLDRANTGAENPLQIALAFTDPFGSVTALVDQSTELRTLSQDGFPIGSLEDFDISLDGVITGSFTNGLRRTLGKVPLATFANNNGLRQVGGSLYEAENNSGNPAIVSAGVAGAGSVVSRALELSNVELSEEFVNLITASTGFSASSRVITTSDDLIQELLTLVR
ncbi:flagellar hook protein FlgE [Algisphaera agarilytica]|uniref:Flagellar hook protein FlgE n=1 Tax=Algisphaera agarilytica TaxID=1385975 RepID=A0A7X0H7J6_9BACT|nr:flagellar hook-basal body complex protein [Algisphaera agarilytica]MBB6430745.1 flagellar hook protein FlgE [Algisphaera agarilytica]